MTVAPVAKRGCVAPMHCHPYTQVRFINEGEADVWTEGGESAKQRLKAGDILALPPYLNHSFALASKAFCRSPPLERRIVNYLDQKIDPQRYRILK